MPKMKTNRSAAKRFRRTANGKIKRNMAGNRHLKTDKTGKRKRRLRTATILDASEMSRIARLLPYGG